MQSPIDFFSHIRIALVVPIAVQGFDELKSEQADPSQTQKALLVVYIHESSEL